ncbi:MAG: hypothetical protein L3J59_14985 [Methylococcaceae bacterium]|nr:hypothetical protein [Methylococcaceae bacterium]
MNAEVASTQVATSIVVPNVAADVPNIVEGAPLSPAYMESLGRMAYIWAWPIINMNSRHTMFSQAPESVLFGGLLPIGQIST